MRRLLQVLATFGILWAGTSLPLSAGSPYTNVGVPSVCGPNGCPPQVQYQLPPQTYSMPTPPIFETYDDVLISHRRVTIEERQVPRIIFEPRVVMDTVQVPHWRTEYEVQQVPRTQSYNVQPYSVPQSYSTAVPQSYNTVPQEMLAMPPSYSVPQSYNTVPYAEPEPRRCRLFVRFLRRDERTAIRDGNAYGIQAAVERESNILASLGPSGYRRVGGHPSGNMPGASFTGTGYSSSPYNVPTCTPKRPMTLAGDATVPGANGLYYRTRAWVQ